MKETQIQIRHHDRCVHGKAWMPEDSGKHPLIIFSHGYNGCMDDFQASAVFFALQGFVSVTITFCGGSTKDPGQYPSVSMSLMTEKEDLTAVLEEAASWENVDEDQIFLFGGSQGGVVSALTAAELKDKIRALILLYPALCIEDNWAERYPDTEDIPEIIEFWGLTLGRKYALDVHGLGTFGRITGYTGPVLIMHGSDDEIVPFSYSVRAQAQYQNARLVIFRHERHGFTEENNRRVDGMSFLFAKEFLEK